MTCNISNNKINLPTVAIYSVIPTRPTHGLPHNSAGLLTPSPLFLSLSYLPLHPFTLGLSYFISSSTPLQYLLLHLSIVPASLSHRSVPCIDRLPHPSIVVVSYPCNFFLLNISFACPSLTRPPPDPAHISMCNNELAALFGAL